MRVLIACEYSGIVRESFKKKGHDVWSCDLDDSFIPGTHIKGDVLDIIDSTWDMMIAFPPCTYLCKAQMWIVSLEPERKELQNKAIDFVLRLMNAPIEKIAIENPVGVLSKAIRPPDQLIQPYEFGDPYKKDIHLWLKNLPVLRGTKLSGGRRSMSNHVNGRMSQAEKSKIKSKFFPGIAKAMAEQWG